ncbi:putative secreted protein [Bradyrhizobium sp. USDA 4341]
MKVMAFFFFLAICSSAQAVEPVFPAKNAPRPNFSPIPSPVIRVDNQCGPVNCCLNDTCRRRYNSEWKSDLGRCGACAVQ